LQQLPPLTPQEWRTVGERIQGLLVPGQTYSFGFEYRSTTATDLELGLGSVDAGPSPLGVMISKGGLPPATDEW